MKCWKQILSLALALTMVIMVAPQIVLAEDKVEPQVVYVDGKKGDDYKNNGETKETAFKTLAKAYESLCSEENGIGTNADAQAKIVLCSDFETGNANFNIPENGKATYTHLGQLTITGISDDVAIRNNNEQRFIQFGGPTILDHVTLDPQTASLRFYVGSDFTLGENVKKAEKATGKVYICGGWCRVGNDETVQIKILGGTVDYVSPVTSNASHSSQTGITNITIGEKATVTNLSAGAIDKKNSGKEPAGGTVTVTVQGKVKNYYAGGKANVGKVTSSTLILAGGSVEHITRSENVTNAYITLDGYNGEYTLPDGKWNALTIQGNSTVTMKAELPETTDLVVETGSTVNMAESDNHLYTGGGTVNYSCDHAWDLTGEIAATCTSKGIKKYHCDKCGGDKQEATSFAEHDFQNDVCTVCHAKRNVVFVADGATGCGSSAENAVGSMKEAYEWLLEHSDIKNDASSEATIVICGNVLFTDDFNRDMALKHQGKVIYTSVYDDVDHKQSNDARLRFSKTGTEHRYQLGGPTVMENIIIDKVSSSATSLTILAPSSLEIKESVQTVNTNWQGSYIQPQAGLTTEQIDGMLLSAHRGYQPMGPENSLASFRAAGELGFDYIETDVYMTTDGVLVCIHDSTVDRTYNGTGNVIDKSYEKLKQLRIDTVRSDYGCPDISTFADADLVIPTFEQYLQICKEYGCKPFIELKDYREGVTKAIIDMALEYFEAKDIVISSGNINALVEAHEINGELFQHLIWGDTSDAGYTNSISVLSQMKNAAGQVYAGIAFNITNLGNETNYNTAKSWIEKANAAGLKTCLRGADDLKEVRLMYQLGIDYYPTNTTSHEKLVSLTKSIEGGWNYSSASGSKIFIRGGILDAVSDEDVSIILNGGMYDFVSAANGESATTGTYTVTIGGHAFVNNLVAGESAKDSTGTRESSVVTIQGDAEVRNLYLAGDRCDTDNLTVHINGGKVVNLVERRANKTGTVKNVTVNVAEPDLLPEKISVSDRTIVIGKLSLNISGKGTLQQGDFEQWNVTLTKGAELHINGAWKAAALNIENGATLYLDDESITEAPEYTGDGKVVLKSQTPGGDDGNQTPGGDEGDKTPGGNDGDKTPGGDNGDKTPSTDESNKTPDDEAGQKSNGDAQGPANTADRSTLLALMQWLAVVSAAGMALLTWRKREYFA